MLEQIAYQTTRPILYSIENLKSLSSIILYSNGPKGKMEAGVDVSADGTAYKFYTNITPSWDFGETELGIQESGESHKDYAKRMKEGGGIGLGGGIGAPPSPAAGGY